MAKRCPRPLASGTLHRPESAGWSGILFLAALLAGSPLASAQEALAPLEAASVQLGPRDPPFRRLADLDGDGDLDAVGAWIDSSRRVYELASYENDGSGAFERAWSATSSSSFFPTTGFLLEIGRLDADQRLDLRIGFRGTLATWRGRAPLAFDLDSEVALPRPATSLALEDLDGDGRSDTIWADSAELHLACTTLGTASLAHGVGPLAVSLRVLPGNGPGGEDLFLLAGSALVKVFRRTPPLALVTGPSFAHGLSGAVCARGDVDRDGDIDAVLSGEGGYRVLRRLTPGDWTLEPLAAGGPADLLVDVDADGDPDGLRCSGAAEALDLDDNVQPTAFQVALNDGSGRFAAAFRLDGLGSPQLAGASDVDRDGDVDLVAGRCVYFTRGAIRPPRSPGAALPTWRGQRDVSDHDGDGDPDVGFSIDSVFVNDGSGRFVVQQPVLQPAPLGTYYRGPGFPGDFDGDGDVDLLAELRRERMRAFDPSPTQVLGGVLIGMALLENQGTGALVPRRLASRAGQSFAIDSLEAEASLTVDLDMDGDLDLVTRNMSAAPRSSLWINTGIGRFGAGRSSLLRVEWGGDVDRDGDSDFLASFPSLYGSDVQLFLGLGQGYVPNVRYGYFEPIVGGIATGDYVRDGFPDFAMIAPWFMAQESVALPNGFRVGGSLFASGMLASNANFSLGSRISLGDLDDDGVCDALIGYLAGEITRVSEVHLKTIPESWGLHSFARAQQLVPPGLLLDLDTDGDLDVLGERIVFNRTLP